MQALAGRHAFVTGGGGGIGSAAAIALAGHGANVTLAGRDRGRLDRASAAIGAAAVVSIDVRDEASVKQAFATARERFGDIDILVNAAGYAHSAPARTTSLDQWREAIDVNLTGVFLCSREALGPMLDARFGRIVNVASTAALRGYRYVAAYCAAKHGVIGFTRALALETAASNVTVNAVCPGYTQTPMLDETLANIVGKTGRSAAQARDALLKETPRGSFVQPAEVAEAVAWLCLPGAEAVTGQAIAVDGGELAG
ncbi:MAG TPA: SDR family NAD(P)-dependent oxidoreductase [Candidatus Eremiobacteraceae bacterium]|nr:SDR family NAD(P)-dependent oxidoreductase [Candidatus Eremiobacteraceae bacterium]